MVAVQAGSSAPVQRPFQAAAGGILNIKAFISSAIKNLGNAILKRIAVAYPKTFLSGLLGCPSFLCVGPKQSSKVLPGFLFSYRLLMLIMSLKSVPCELIKMACSSGWNNEECPMDLF